MLDKKDRIILNELQTDADRKIYQLEKSTLLPRSTIHNRIKRLKRDGVIQKIKAVVDPRELDLNVTALVHIIVTFKKGARTIAERISKLDNVEEVHLTAGEFDIIAKGIDTAVKSFLEKRQIKEEELKDKKPKKKK